MKALSMTQPWAQAVFLGLKHYETRSWYTNYRGPLLIHAAKNFPKAAQEFARTERALGRGNSRLALGAIIGWVELVEVYQAEVLIQLGRVTGLEHLYGDYSPGRWAWEFQQPLLLSQPVPYRGALGLFTVYETALICPY